MVSAMHEHVHQWTGEQQQPRQRAEQVSTVLDPEKPPGHSRQYQTAEAEAPERWWIVVSSEFFHGRCPDR